MIRNCFAGAMLALFFGAFGAQAQLSPEETVAQFEAAEGLSVSLFAAEPELRNPTCIDVDAYGRVWVLEAANYRLFNQSIEDPQGDRIRVLEDTNGDGRSDKATTFYQDASLQAPLGIAVLGDRVYVCQSPDIFYLRDTNADGVADEKTVVLTGFKGVDHDHAIHGIVFGPDGFLYMSNGDGGLDVVDGSGRRVHAGRDAPLPAATVLRMDPEGHHLEVLAWNMRNPYEPAVDSFGNVFISDNDDDGNEQTRINYVLEGGNYGYWMAGTNGTQRGNKRLDRVHWNADRPGVMPTMLKTGFGSPTGLLVYEGALLPQRLYGALIHSDAGPGVIRAYRPKTAGAGYSAELETLVSSPKDSWFRPSDVAAAPDGSIFIADWYDAGVGGHRMVDAEQGRIYRIASSDGSDRYTVSPPDLSSAEGLQKAFLSPNHARRFLAHEVLARGDSESAGTILQRLFRESDPVARARAFWLLAQNPETRDEAIRDAAADARAAFRIQAVRAISRFATAGASPVEAFLNDSDAGVRRQLLLEMAFEYAAPATGMPTREDSALHLAWLAALQATFEGDDRFYREALGIAARGYESAAFEYALAASNGTWDLTVAELALQYHPAGVLAAAMAAAADSDNASGVREQALRTVDAIGGKEAGEFLVSTAKRQDDPTLQAVALELLGRNRGAEWRDAMDEHGLDAYLIEALRQNPNRTEVLEQLRELDRPGVVPGLMAALGDPNLSDANTLTALAVAQGVINRADGLQMDTWLETLRDRLDNPNEETQSAVLGVVGQMRGERQRDLLLTYALNAERTSGLRLNAVRALLRSKGGAQALLELAQEEAFAEDIRYRVLESLRTTRWESVKAVATTAFPREATREGEALPPVRDLLAQHGDPENGKRVFMDEARGQCARCHSVDDTQSAVGPGLNAIGSKLSRRALVESILDPSAGIAHEYQSWIIDTKTERGLTGYIRSEDSEALELVDSMGAQTRVALDDIRLREKSAISVMPSDLASAMTTQELVDLIAYLVLLK